MRWFFRAALGPLSFFFFLSFSLPVSLRKLTELNPALSGLLDQWLIAPVPVQKGFRDFFPTFSQLSHHKGQSSFLSLF